jgi:AbrB family looped-hinge helix DNA binding protein
MTQLRKVDNLDFRVQIDAGGRFVLPAKIRKELHIKPGDDIVLRLENGSVNLVPLHQAVLLAQQTIRKYIPEGTSLVADLIQARKEEAAHE